MVHKDLVVTDIKKANITFTLPYIQSVFILKNRTYAVPSVSKVRSPLPIYSQPPPNISERSQVSKLAIGSPLPIFQRALNYFAGGYEHFRARY